MKRKNPDDVCIYIYACREEGGAGYIHMKKTLKNPGRVKKS